MKPYEFAHTYGTTVCLADAMRAKHAAGNPHHRHISFALGSELGPTQHSTKYSPTIPPRSASLGPTFRPCRTRNETSQRKKAIALDGRSYNILPTTATVAKKTHERKNTTHVCVCVCGLDVLQQHIVEAERTVSHGISYIYICVYAFEAAVCVHDTDVCRPCVPNDGDDACASPGRPNDGVEWDRMGIALPENRATGIHRDVRDGVAPITQTDLAEGEKLCICTYMHSVRPHVRRTDAQIYTDSVLVRSPHPPCSTQHHRHTTPSLFSNVDGYQKFVVAVAVAVVCSPILLLVHVCVCRVTIISQNSETAQPSRVNRMTATSTTIYYVYLYTFHMAISVWFSENIHTAESDSVSFAQLTPANVW